MPPHQTWSKLDHEGRSFGRRFEMPIAVDLPLRPVHQRASVGVSSRVPHDSRWQGQLRDRARGARNTEKEGPRHTVEGVKELANQARTLGELVLDLCTCTVWGTVWWRVCVCESGLWGSRGPV